jgi:hypothetical protein
MRVNTWPMMKRTGPRGTIVHTTAKPCELIKQIGLEVSSTLQCEMVAELGGRSGATHWHNKALHTDTLQRRRSCLTSGFGCG